MKTEAMTGARPVDWRCLHCEHRYVDDYDPKAPMIERSCPKCRSNSVRRQPARPERPD